VGQKISTKIIKIERDTLKVHVSLKKLTPDPYSELIDKFEVGKTYDAIVTKVQEYGVFASLAPGLEGLIHSSKILWSKRNLHPGKTLSTSQRIKVVLLEKDSDKRRLSLSYKDTFENPFKKFAKDYKVGSIVSCVVKNRVDYGLFLTIDGTDIDGLCHINDVHFENQESEIAKYRKGQKIKAVKILEINTEEEKIRLSLKLEKDDFDFFLQRNIGDTITGTVHSTTSAGIYIQVGSKKNLKILIKKNNLAVEPENQRPMRWNRGDSCDSVITHLDKATRTVQLSIKKLEEIQSAEAVKRYGSKDSGGVLADLFDFSKVKTKKSKSKK
jgi:small subunit ribosomal protein S1